MVTASAAFMPPPPPALTSNEYAKAYEEVKTVGGVNSTARPADRSQVATFYALSSPTYIFNLAARQIAADRDFSLTDNARALALINMPTNDALVVSFFAKYEYKFWRPETAIRAGDTDGNRRTDVAGAFVPFILTPCFPSYPSNHASGTNGGLEMMRRLFGAAGHDMTVTNSVPALGSLPAAVITKHYTQLKQIADDVDDARVYAGIHWRFDQTAGNVLGRAVATEIYKTALRPVHGRQ